MARIFISYRRGQAAGFAGRLAEDLGRRFNTSEVFRDVEDIASGEDFVERLDVALRDCRILIAVIDRMWLSASHGGRRRLDDPRDFVRTEITKALNSGVKVIPVLVDGATMPGENELPEGLKALARRQAHELSDTRWDYDVERLAAVITSALADDAEPSPHTSARPRRRWLARLAAAVGLAAISAVAWRWWSRPPDLNGTWDLPDGSYWIIGHEGHHVEIDVVHQDSRQIWQHGRGSIEGNRINFHLDLVYQAGISIEGELTISADATRLTGTAARSQSGSRTNLILQRRRR